MARSLDDDQAEHIVTIDLAGRSSMADFLVIGSGRSTRHVGALAQNLQERLKAAGVTGIALEGMTRCDWVLVDAGDVIIHLFRPEVRSFYNLEKLWGAESPPDVQAKPEFIPISLESGADDGDEDDGNDFEGDFDDEDA